MMTSLADRIRNPEFEKWVKSALALDIAREALKEFVETKNNKNHESLIEQFSGTCSSCDFNTCANCQNKTCTNKQLKEHIKISHVKQSPSFVNTNPKDCWSKPWEYAKCFMPPNVYRGTLTADETDFPGLISVIVNNWDLRATISQEDRKFNKARDVRNEIMHNPGFAVDDQTFNDYIGVMNTMLCCLPLSDKTKLALSRIGELTRGTLTITNKDIGRVIDEAIALLGLRNNEIKDSIQEISQLSKLCKQEINDKVEVGVRRIEDKTEEGVEKVRGVTEYGLKDIKEVKEKATDQLRVAQKEGFDALAIKAEQEGEKIEKKAEHKQNEIKREQERLKGIMKDGMKELDSNINSIRKKTLETENVRDEIIQNADRIQRTSDTCVTTVQDITKACLESLYNQTETFRDSKSQSEHDTRNEFENMQTKFRAEILEVLREMRELKSEKEETRAHTESISKGTEQLATIIGDWNSSPENDTPNDIEDNNMKSSGIKQDEERAISDGKSRSRKVFDHSKIEHDYDEKISSITGMVKVGDDRLAVVDRINNRVKIINMRSNTVTSFLDVDHPFDITCVNDNVLVVSCAGTLQFLELKDNTLYLGEKRFDFEDRCFGVDYTHVLELLIVFVATANAVRIIDMEGNTVREFQLKQTVQGLLKSVYIHFNNDASRLYVTDNNCKRILCLNSLDGTILHSYDNDKLIGPSGLAVDTAGNVFIAGYLSDNIHIVSPDGSDVSIVLDKLDGIENPKAIVYCGKDHSLYVSHTEDGNNVVTIHPLQTQTQSR